VRSGRRSSGRNRGRRSGFRSCGTRCREEGRLGRGEACGHGGRGLDGRLVGRESGWAGGGVPCGAGRGSARGPGSGVVQHLAHFFEANDHRVFADTRLEGFEIRAGFGVRIVTLQVDMRSSVHASATRLSVEIREAKRQRASHRAVGPRVSVVSAEEIFITGVVRRACPFHTFCSLKLNARQVLGGDPQIRMVHA
jgi:hypothetical protein